MLAAYVVEGTVSAHSIYALLRFINNEQIKLHIAYPFQLVIYAAEIDRTFKPLQGFKGNHAIHIFCCVENIGRIALARHNAGLPF